MLQFIDSATFMASSLSNLVSNFLERILQLNINTDMMIKNVRLVELNISFVTFSLNT